MGFIDSSILMVCAEERDDITRADSDKFDSIFHQVQTLHDSGIFIKCQVQFLFLFIKSRKFCITINCLATPFFLDSGNFE